MTKSTPTVYFDVDDISNAARAIKRVDRANAVLVVGRDSEAHHYCSKLKAWAGSDEMRLSGVWVVVEGTDWS